jgi:hypothetical protein
MIPLASWTFAALIAMGHPQSQPAARTFEVKRLCGKVVHVDCSKPNFASKGLRGVRLSLYRRGTEVSCCEALAPLAVTTTGRWGHFKFTKMTEGPYWIAAQVGARDYKIAIQFTPPKAGTAALCADEEYQIDDSGDFVLGQYVTVD